jgi:hypothetical protein
MTVGWEMQKNVTGFASPDTKVCLVKGHDCSPGIQTARTTYFFDITKKSLFKEKNEYLWSLRRDDSSLSHFILLKFVSDIMEAKFFLKKKKT